MDLILLGSNFIRWPKNWYWRYFLVGTLKHTVSSVIRSALQVHLFILESSSTWFLFSNPEVFRGDNTITSRGLDFVRTIPEWLSPLKSHVSELLWHVNQFRFLPIGILKNNQAMRSNYFSQISRASKNTCATLKTLCHDIILSKGQKEFLEYRNSGIIWLLIVTWPPKYLSIIYKILKIKKNI